MNILQTLLISGIGAVLHTDFNHKVHKGHKVVGGTTLWNFGGLKILCLEVKTCLGSIDEIFVSIVSFVV